MQLKITLCAAPNRLYGFELAIILWLLSEEQNNMESPCHYSHLWNEGIS